MTGPVLGDRALPAVAMTTAALMLGHQVAAKAVRDAVFLSAWPASALPGIVIVTAITAVVAVPLYARLLGTFGPRHVVPLGFLASAAGHLLEWQFAGGGRLGAVIVYVHIAAIGALLLSGFWSLVSELFDPRGARTSYGRIAAAGTLGGLVGGVLTARLALAWPANAPLLFLAVLHAASAGGAWWLGRWPAMFPTAADSGSTWSVNLRVLRQTPHLKTLALVVLTSTAAAAIVDFLLKAEVSRPDHFASQAELLRFFAVFYAIVQFVAFLAQASASRVIRQFGLARTISTLPAGVTAASALALLYPTFYAFVFARGTEAVLRGSLFRSGYELLFVPMEPAEKRRIKTFLDVTCDRAGDAVGALIVWLALFTDVAFQRSELIAAGLVLAIAGLWLTRRLDTLYLGVVERHLVKQGEPTPILVGSETGWTVLELPATSPPATAPIPAPVPTNRSDDVQLRLLIDLRSGDRDTVENRLVSLRAPDTLAVVQIIRLLAWDDVAPAARRTLEPVAAANVGLLVDALTDPDTDFAIRRRIPRVLSVVDAQRAVDGLVAGLGDARFEVRYQCGRALDRILSRSPHLAVESGAILQVVERELSVPAPVWRSHHLLDRPDSDAIVVTDQAERNLEHVFTLLSTFLPREPLQVAFRATQSPEPGLRGLAFEYLDGVLPAEIRAKFWALVDTGDRPSGDRGTPEHVLDELRRSTEMAVVDRPDTATPSSGDAPAQSGLRRTTTPR